MRVSLRCSITILNSEKMERCPPPKKVYSAGTHVYNPPSHLSPTCIHIIGGNPAHLIDGDYYTEY